MQFRNKEEAIEKNAILFITCMRVTINTKTSVAGTGSLVKQQNILISYHVNWEF